MNERLFFPATQRNYESLKKVLVSLLPSNGSVLEIASGSGEHAVRFQKCFPSLKWQTSDPNSSHRRSIRAWIRYEQLSLKMPQPLDIDVERRPWALPPEIRSTLQSIVCINMIHVTPWSSTQALLLESSRLLQINQLLFLYGPFKRNGEHTSLSNANFDDSLKAQNSSWGVRDLDELSVEAMKNGLEIYEVVEMPANNLSVFFTKI